MKVLLINGCPRKDECTNRALKEVIKGLESEGVQGDIFWIGTKPISGCLSCFQCQTKGECVLNDIVNEFNKKAKDYDGFIFGSPVYYGSANGSLSSFMDRAFFSEFASKGYQAEKTYFYLKPAAAVASARRGGTVPTWDQPNKYFALLQMPILTGGYWNEVHGHSAADVEKDLEGLQCMRTLGRNMAWFIKIKEAASKAGVQLPKIETEKFMTDFIR